MVKIRPYDHTAASQLLSVQAAPRPVLRSNRPLLLLAL